ncbi:unnamed protein product [Lampetra fluviatilis]
MGCGTSTAAVNPARGPDAPIAVAREGNYGGVYVGGAASSSSSRDAGCGGDERSNEAVSVVSVGGERLCDDDGGNDGD